MSYSTHPKRLWHMRTKIPPILVQLAGDRPQ